MESSEAKCEQLHRYNGSERCQFVLNNSDCQNVDGFLNYINLIYCDFSLAPGEAIAILTIWIFFLFTVVAIATDNLYIGFPDPSFSFYGYRSVTSFIPSEAFLRDIIFYLMAAFWAFAIYYKGAVKLLDALGFLVMYISYVAVVILGPKIHDRFCMTQGDVFDDEDMEEPCNISVEDSINHSMADFSSECMITNDGNDSVAVWENYDDSERTPLIGARSKYTYPRRREHSFLRAISPVNVEKWATASWYTRAYWIIQAPSVFVLKATIPLVDKEEVNNNWCRILNSMHLVAGPIFVIFALKCGTVMVGGLVPVWSIVLGVSATFALGIFCVTSDSEPPRWHTAFAFLGFSISIVWIYILANEIVSALKTIGILLSINDVILGLTVLAWGNSVGDFIANMSVAKGGSPTMAVAACVGGPLMNLLVGMGLPFTVKLVTQEHNILVKYNSSIAILSGFLFASLASTLLAMLFLRFRVHRGYGIYLLVLYIAFMVCVILNAVQVI